MRRHFVIVALMMCASQLSADHPERFGFGRVPSDQEIKQWDIDIMPDGSGLPRGRGTVPKGLLVYQQKCLACHGKNGKGGVNDQLVGQHDSTVVFAKDRDAVRTIGNYWPYATTLYDYIYRAMPQTSPGSLQADEVYSLVAYLLYLNGILEYDDEVNAGNLAGISMPARYRFYWSDEVNE